VKKTRRKKKLDASTEARRIARNRIGSPPAERVLPDKRSRPPKHKKRMMEEALE
jgi:hypothetical protein